MTAIHTLGEKGNNVNPNLHRADLIARNHLAANVKTVVIKSYFANFLCRASQCSSSRPPEKDKIRTMNSISKFPSMENVNCRCHMHRNMYNGDKELSRVSHNEYTIQ